MFLTDIVSIVGNSLAEDVFGPDADRPGILDERTSRSVACAMRLMYIPSSIADQFSVDVHISIVRLCLALALVRHCPATGTIVHSATGFVNRHPNKISISSSRKENFDMSYFVNRKDVQPVRYEGHVGYHLLDESNGCVNGFSAGITFYTESQRPRAKARGL